MTGDQIEALSLRWQQGWIAPVPVEEGTDAAPAKDDLTYWGTPKEAETSWLELQGDLTPLGRYIEWGTQDDLLQFDRPEELTEGTFWSLESRANQPHFKTEWREQYRRDAWNTAINRAAKEGDVDSWVVEAEFRKAGRTQDDDEFGWNPFEGFLKTAGMPYGNGDWLSADQVLQAIGHVDPDDETQTPDADGLERLEFLRSAGGPHEFEQRATAELTRMYRYERLSEQGIPGFVTFMAGQIAADPMNILPAKLVYSSFKALWTLRKIRKGMRNIRNVRDADRTIRVAQETEKFIPKLALSIGTVGFAGGASLGLESYVSQTPMTVEEYKMAGLFSVGLVLGINGLSGLAGFRRASVIRQAEEQRRLLVRDAQGREVEISPADIKTEIHLESEHARVNHQVDEAIANGDTPIEIIGEAVSAVAARLNQVAGLGLRAFSDLQLSPNPAMRWFYALLGRESLETTGPRQEVVVAHRRRSIARIADAVKHLTTEAAQKHGTDPLIAKDMDHKVLRVTQTKVAGEPVVNDFLQAVIEVADEGPGRLESDYWKKFNLTPEQKASILLHAKRVDRVYDDMRLGMEPAGWGKSKEFYWSHGNREEALVFKPEAIADFKRRARRHLVLEGKKPDGSDYTPEEAVAKVDRDLIQIQNVFKKSDAAEEVGFHLNDEGELKVHMLNDNALPLEAGSLKERTLDYPWRVLRSFHLDDLQVYFNILMDRAPAEAAQVHLANLKSSSVHKVLPPEPVVRVETPRAVEGEAPREVDTPNYAEKMNTDFTPRRRAIEMEMAGEGNAEELLATFQEVANRTTANIRASEAANAKPLKINAEIKSDVERLRAVAEARKGAGDAMLDELVVRVNKEIDLLDSLEPKLDKLEIELGQATRKRQRLLDATKKNRQRFQEKLNKQIEVQKERVEAGRARQEKPIPEQLDDITVSERKLVEVATERGRKAKSKLEGRILHTQSQAEIEEASVRVGEWVQGGRVGKLSSEGSPAYTNRDAQKDIDFLTEHGASSTLKRVLQKPTDKFINTRRKSGESYRKKNQKAQEELSDFDSSPGDRFTPKERAELDELLSKRDDLKWEQDYNISNNINPELSWVQEIDNHRTKEVIPKYRKLLRKWSDPNKPPEDNPLISPEEVEIIHARNQKVLDLNVELTRLSAEVNETKAFISASIGHLEQATEISHYQEALRKRSGGRGWEEEGLAARILKNRGEAKTARDDAVVAKAAAKESTKEYRDVLGVHPERGEVTEGQFNAKVKGLRRDTAAKHMSLGVVIQNGRYTFTKDKGTIGGRVGEWWDKKIDAATEKRKVLTKSLVNEPRVGGEAELSKLDEEIRKLNQQKLTEASTLARFRDALLGQEVSERLAAQEIFGQIMSAGTMGLVRNISHSSGLDIGIMIAKFDNVHRVFEATKFALESSLLRGLALKDPDVAQTMAQIAEAAMISGLDSMGGLSGRGASSLIESAESFVPQVKGGWSRKVVEKSRAGVGHLGRGWRTSTGFIIVEPALKAASHTLEVTRFLEISEKLVDGRGINDFEAAILKKMGLSSEDAERAYWQWFQHDNTTMTRTGLRQITWEGPNSWPDKGLQNRVAGAIDRMSEEVSLRPDIEDVGKVIPSGVPLRYRPFRETLISPLKAFATYGEKVIGGRVVSTATRLPKHPEEALPAFSKAFKAALFYYSWQEVREMAENAGLPTRLQRKRTTYEKILNAFMSVGMGGRAGDLIRHPPSLGPEGRPIYLMKEKAIGRILFAVSPGTKGAVDIVSAFAESFEVDTEKKAYKWVLYAPFIGITGARAFASEMVDQLVKANALLPSPSIHAPLKEQD
jgi:hypothetical protein